MLVFDFSFFLFSPVDSGKGRARAGMSCPSERGERPVRGGKVSPGKRRYPLPDGENALSIFE